MFLLICIVVGAIILLNFGKILDLLISIGDPPGTKEFMERMLNAPNPSMVCPHCQTKGYVHTKPVTRKKGISGAKATGAVLTGGLSILATGLSRKEGMTQAHCNKCGATWDF